MNEKFVIHGGIPLKGKINASYNKNALLPILASLLITKDEILIPQIDILDGKNQLEILKNLGYKVIINNNYINIFPSEEINVNIDNNLIASLRASILFLGPLLALKKEVVFHTPGGDNLSRSFDFHIDFLIKMGAEISIENNLIIGKAPNGLKGINYFLNIPSVGTTQHLILTAILSKEGEITTINNCSLEPEILYLIHILKNYFNCNINKKGSIITIIGNGKRFKSNKKHIIPIIPDRIEILTYLSLSLITNGDIEIIGNDLLSYMSNYDLYYLNKLGTKLIINENSIKIEKNYFLKKLSSISYLYSEEFPGFSTDFAPIFCTLLGISNGESIFQENVHKERFNYIDELNKFGGNFIKLNNSQIKIIGGNYKASKGICTDIRGGMSIIMAALSSKGISEIYNIFHIFRGYSNFIQNIQNLGGKIFLKK